MATLADLPVELLLDQLFPLIPVPDLLHLLSVNRYFANLGSDDTFWKRKLQADFNFSGAGTARDKGWKLIYKGIRKPRVFVWGENSNYRLGLSVAPKTRIRDGVPMPTELKIPGVRVVSLVAGGMSFHALDSKGHVYVWGTLDATAYANENHQFANPSQPAAEPLRLNLPTPIRSISTGRIHSAFLDSTNHIWSLTSWGRPAKLVTNALDATLPDSTPIQVECGWAFTSALTATGDVYVWWPFHPRMKDIIDAKAAEFDEAGDKNAIANNGEIPCVVWDLNFTPTKLPALPSTLPGLTGSAEQPDEQPVVICKLAAADNNLVALTNKGHVLVFNHLDGEATVASGTWIYLPKFSDVKEVSALSEFASSPLQTLRITHITANFQSFVAYSTGDTSVVLMGDLSPDAPDIVATSATTTSEAPTDPEFRPDIIPSLQHKSVISVSIGDYHNAALTATGKLLTWGGYSKGGLGLGDPSKIPIGQPGGYANQAQVDRGWGTPGGVEEPTEVHFDHHSKSGKRRDRFCFAATAAGWHTGALVIDLDENDEDDEEVVNPPEPAIAPMRGILPHPIPPYAENDPSAPRRYYPTGDQDNIPMIGRGMLRGGGHFRVGFAGRGMNRGDHGGMRNNHGQFHPEDM